MAHTFPFSPQDPNSNKSMDQRDGDRAIDWKPKVFCFLQPSLQKYYKEVMYQIVDSEIISHF